MRCILVLSLVCLGIAIYYASHTERESLFWFGISFVLWGNWFIREQQIHQMRYLTASLALMQREYERAREGYVNILRSMTSGVIVMNVENRITHANQAVLSIFGASSLQLIGKQIFEFPQFKAVTQLLSQTLDTRPPFIHNIKQAEIDVERFDGSTIPLGLSTAVLRDHQETLIGYIIICQDLTEVKALREKAERDRRLASLGEMAAGVAHEVRNPLSSVMGFVSVIDEELPEGHEHKPYLSIIMKEIERASKVIQDVLDFARQWTPDLKQGDLNAHIQDAVFQLSNQLKQSQIEVKTDYCTEGKMVLFDREQLHQVWLNLIKNAIDSMQPGGKLNLSTRFIPNPIGEDLIRIDLEDSGSGILDQHLAKIFAPFFTSKQSQRGTGLGLAITSRIIMEHKGHIDVTSKIGQGSRFSITFPRGKSLVHVNSEK